MKNRKILFFGFTLLLPFLFLLFVEIFLRIFNLFPCPPLFYQKNQTVTVNPYVGERYFNKKLMPVPTLYPQSFSARKKPNTMRIFCLGGSTTAGFPYDMTVPFPQQLYFLLSENYPNKHFEVINLGLSAINSFTVLDWMPEILEQQPDLILIYMGHNEFYGAYGSGSTISFGHNGALVRLILKLQKLHLVQMIKALIQNLTPKPDTQQSTTVMEKVIGDRSIPIGSNLRKVTYQNFGKNLELLLENCKKHHVPVVLSKLVCNLKDQPPLDSYSAGLTEALKWFNTADSLLQQGDSLNAYEGYLKARDYDAIPFRAPERINEIIVQKAKHFNFHLVDMESVFRSKSPFQIPGKNLFSDHLHPNPVGYRLMANAFFKALIKNELIPRPAKLHQLNSQPLFVTDLDWEIGSIRIFKLNHSWPFSTGTVDYKKYAPLFDRFTADMAMDFLFKNAPWGRVHSQMAKHYEKEGNLSKACAEYQAIIAMYPQKVTYHEKLIRCAKKLKNWPLVKWACQNALPYTQAKGMFYYHLAMAEWMMGHRNEALKYIDLASQAPELNREQLTNIFFTYARLLIEVKQVKTAKEVLEALVKEVPNFTPAQKLLQKLNRSL